MGSALRQAYNSRQFICIDCVEILRNEQRVDKPFNGFKAVGSRCFSSSPIVTDREESKEKIPLVKSNSNVTDKKPLENTLLEFPKIKGWSSKRVQAREEPEEKAITQSEFKSESKFKSKSEQPEVMISLSDKELKRIFPTVSLEVGRQVLSQLDTKAIQVLQRRPELGKRLIGTLDLKPDDADVNKMKFSSSTKIPEGWRKDTTLEGWQRQVYALREKFAGEKWNPRKKLSREAMEGIRALKVHAPQLNSGHIAKMFQISPESIRRILKSKWEPTEEEADRMAERWVRRGERVKSELKKERKEKRLQDLKEKKDKAVLLPLLSTARSGSKRRMKRPKRNEKGTDNGTENDNRYDKPSDVTGKLGTQIF